MIPDPLHPVGQGFDAGYAQAIKDVVEWLRGAEGRDAYYNHDEDRMTVAPWSREKYAAFIESRFPATRNREEEGDG